jgi:hypothetical protein
VTNIQALETYHNGHHFRSRVEARWAVFFDHLSIPYEYEPAGYQGPTGLRYLPDFKIQLPKDCWFEVKGAEPNKDEMAKARMLATGTNLPVLVAFGNFSSGYRSVPVPVMILLTPDGSMNGLLKWSHCPSCGQVAPVKVTSNSAPCNCDYPYASAILQQAYNAARASRFGT